MIKLSFNFIHNSPKNLFRLTTNSRNIRELSLSQSSNVDDRHLKRIKEKIDESKKKIKWRSETGEQPETWYSKFKLFGDQEQNSDFITMMQQPIDLSPKAVKNWYSRRKVKVERFLQSYIPQRHAILGSDLATAHFIVHRGGAVRFTSSPNWVRADEYGEYNLPDRFNADYKVEAIRCDNMKLYYEGLENIRALQTLRFWSLRNCKQIDDWCLDRISGSENPKLEVLDLSGTLITYRGLSCMYRLENLKLLILDDPLSSKEMELSCAMLEVAIPKLKITAAKEIHSTI